ncbi:MAG: hypothetical protein ABUL72_04615 [Armatimonadota bacterium]
MPEPIRPKPRKPLIDPLWQQEWLKGTAGVALTCAVFVLAGPAIFSSVLQKPIDMGPLTFVSLLLAVLQGASHLGVIAEWEFVSKKLYLNVLFAAILGSLVLGFGDLVNVPIFGAAGGVMLVARILNTVSLGFALFAATAAKQIPIN